MWIWKILEEPLIELVRAANPLLIHKERLFFYCFKSCFFPLEYRKKLRKYKTCNI